MPTYNCNVCGLDFYHAASLTRHMRLFHNVDVEPAFQCALCKSSFGQLSTLDRHIYIYHDYLRTMGVCERPYQCACCGSCYSQRRDLKRHMIDERPYRCIVCGKGYHQRRNMNRHIQLSHYHRGDELTPGAQATTSTQHTESLHGITSTVSTVTSPLGSAIVATVHSAISPSAISPVVMTTVSQASGTVTHLGLTRAYGNECSICFESLNDGETRTTPCCSKIFHFACLRTVQTNSGEVFPCPHCQKMLTYLWLNNPDHWVD